MPCCPTARMMVSARNINYYSIKKMLQSPAKAQFPLLMHPSPFDNRVARRFKRALRQADSMGIRVGAFLRRYPMMRVSVIVYVALLHLWVMFVLLSTTPN